MSRATSSLKKPIKTLFCTILIQSSITGLATPSRDIYVDPEAGVSFSISPDLISSPSNSRFMSFIKRGEGYLDVDTPFTVSVEFGRDCAGPRNFRTSYKDMVQQRKASYTFDGKAPNEKEISWLGKKASILEVRAKLNGSSESSLIYDVTAFANNRIIKINGKSGDKSYPVLKKEIESIMSNFKIAFNASCPKETKNGSVTKFTDVDMGIEFNYPSGLTWMFTGGDLLYFSRENQPDESILIEYLRECKPYSNKFSLQPARDFRLDEIKKGGAINSLKISQTQIDKNPGYYLEYIEIDSGKTIYNYEAIGFSKQKSISIRAENAKVGYEKTKGVVKTIAKSMTLKASPCSTRNGKTE